MELVKLIGRFLRAKGSNTKLNSSLNKLREADQVTATINTRLKEIKGRFEQQTVKRS